MGASLIATLPVIVVFFFRETLSSACECSWRDGRCAVHALGRHSGRPSNEALATFYFARAASISISTATSLPIIHSPPAPFPIPKSLRLSGAVVTRQRVVGFFAADFGIAEQLNVQCYRTRHTVHRQIAGDFSRVRARLFHPPALEGDLRILAHVEEIRGAQMLVPFRIRGIDARRLNRRDDR